MNKAQIRAGDGDQAADEDRAVTEAWTPRATPRDRFVDANGLTFHYLDWDSPRAAAGPPIVLLHGLRDQAHEWDPIVPDLTAHGRVLALDQRGHGGSARPVVTRPRISPPTSRRSARRLTSTARS